MSDEMNDQVDARGEAYERFWQDFGAKGHKVSMKMLEQLYDAGYEAALQPLDDETGLKDENGLLSCPFCGGKAVLVDHAVEYPGRFTQKYVACRAEECDASVMTNSFDTKQEAIEAWNRRQGSLNGGWVDLKDKWPEGCEGVHREAR